MIQWQLRFNPSFSELEGHVTKMNAGLRQNMHEAVTDIGDILRNYAKDKIQTGPRSGHFYRKNHGGRIAVQHVDEKRAYSGANSYSLKDLHQASAIGEWPKSDTGELVRSIYAQPINYLSVAVGTNMEYAEALEGNPNKSSDRNRPFLKRSLDENAIKIRQILDAALSQPLNIKATFTTDRK